MTLSVTYVPDEVAERIDDMSGVLGKHHRAQVIDEKDGVITVIVTLKMGGNERPYTVKLVADPNNFHARANWHGVRRLLWWQHRMARINEIRANKLGLKALS